MAPEISREEKYISLPSEKYASHCTHRNAQPIGGGGRVERQHRLAIHPPIRGSKDMTPMNKHNLMLDELKHAMHLGNAFSWVASGKVQVGNYWISSQAMYWDNKPA